uniref:NADH-ubiquinone oxidoreductase chain 1 n=2 Tax=Apis cerana TaxID=7461 RepID=A0A2Z5UXH4_APICE|nr:NADH dehydrogenase subunit 1 [Apis cerana]BAV58424.1 NADH dehydrogenase subunit 1 [Apis cerana japonica]UDH54251.1 NADH dehydrogenase subunit 1 [Apis cerana]BAY00649.1 NADH dehydrogenase subunit 1 [Apis cerana japonica]BBA21027.1 NADH dehydrogenase subunit 1 [Apis cerana japonica]
MWILINLLILMVMVLISVAFLTLLERKILGYIQDRKGPNKIFLFGLFQPFSDALKLLSKEWYFFNYSNLYIYSPMMMFFLSLVMWILYPWISCMYNLEFSILFMLLILGLSVYPVLFVGWISNCNYAILGSMRLVSTMISFEINLFFLVFSLMLLIESFSFNDFINYQKMIKFVILLYPLYLMMLTSMLIELNRTPFDLIEGESELVSGFNIEYHSSMFVLIFLSEYMNIMFMSMILSVMFFGFSYWSLKFIMIYLFHICLIIWIRGILPRIRYDKLMYMCWTEMLMLVMIYLMYLYFIKEIIL